MENLIRFIHTSTFIYLAMGSFTQSFFCHLLFRLPLHVCLTVLIGSGKYMNLFNIRLNASIEQKQLWINTYKGVS